MGEASEIIKFRKGLPQGDAVCPRLFTVCLNPIAWTISASEGYRLSKPIGTTVTDDLKIFAASESKLSSAMNSVRAAMEDVGLIWNPKKCAVAHFKRGVRVSKSTGLLRESRIDGVVEEQKWQGKLITARKEDGDLNTEQCFWWLSEWRTCPTHTIAGMFEIYEQLLPTRLYAIHKTQASLIRDPTCRLCGTAPESMAHVLSACPALAQTKYLARHDAVIKVLFFDIIEDLALIEASPPWYSPTKPQPAYEGAHAQSYWDVPVYGVYQDLRANRIHARIVNHQEKKVIAMEMSCPWVSNRQKKTSEKTMKYAPLRWELKQKYLGYEILQYNIIVDVLGGWSTDVEVAVKELVGRRHRDVLKKMKRACLSVTLHIARTFKVATH